MSCHFRISILPSKRPRDASPVIVSALLPGIDLGNQRGAVRQAPVETRAIQDAASFMSFNTRPFSEEAVLSEKRGLSVAWPDPACHQSIH